MLTANRLGGFTPIGLPQYANNLFGTMRLPFMSISPFRIKKYSPLTWVNDRRSSHTHLIFPATLSPKRAPARARKKATPPPINIFVRLKWIKLYGVKNERHNMSATERNAPTAGSLVRIPGEIRPIMKPPRKKLTRLSRPCIRNRKLIERNLPTTTSPISPPKNSSTAMKIPALAIIHFLEKG